MIEAFLAKVVAKFLLFEIGQNPQSGTAPGSGSVWPSDVAQSALNFDHESVPFLVGQSCDLAG